MHLDVMDGHFVPNITFGAPVIKWVRPYTKKPFDVHLMISEPLRYIDDFAAAGADIITFHVECDSDINATIDKIRENGVLPGLVIKPATPAEAVFPYLDKLALVLVMTVEPGFGGQSFMRTAASAKPPLHRLPQPVWTSAWQARRSLRRTTRQKRSPLCKHTDTYSTTKAQPEKLCLFLYLYLYSSQTTAAITLSGSSKIYTNCKFFTLDFSRRSATVSLLPVLSFSAFSVSACRSSSESSPE